MPKEMKQRIIDFPIAKPAPAMRPKRATTTRQQLEVVYTLDGGETTYSLDLQPGDAVLWFLRLDWDDDLPVGRFLHLEQGGESITHSFIDYGSAWEHGEIKLEGTYDNGTTDDAAHLIFDRLAGFTAGTYDLVFDLPALARARVEKALIVRGYSTTTPGTLQDGGGYGYWGVSYNSYTAPKQTNMPVSLSLTATQSLAVHLWQMSYSIHPPAGYVTTQGTTLLSYSQLDTEEGNVNRTRVTIGSVVSGSTITVAEPTTGGASYSAGATSYDYRAIVINGQ